MLAADFGRLAAEVAEVEAAGVKMIQFDIMDGHFVPNISFGPPLVAALRRYSPLAFDVQLMISNPRQYVEAFVRAGADHITFHIETEDRPLDLVDELHKAGVTAGVALNPETDVLHIIDVAPYCEMVLVMTVHPGFGGQEFLPETATEGQTGARPGGTRHTHSGRWRHIAGNGANRCRLRGRYSGRRKRHLR